MIKSLLLIVILLPACTEQSVFYKTPESCERPFIIHNDGYTLYCEEVRKVNGYNCVPDHFWYDSSTEKPEDKLYREHLDVIFWSQADTLIVNRIQNHDCKIEESINTNMMTLRFWAN